MNRGSLSQDEIDALLQQTSDNDEADDVTLDSLLTPFEQDALGEIGNISFGSASTALSSLLGQKVEITTPHMKAVLKERLDKEFPTPHVSVHVQYTAGFKGINLFVINSGDAKIIADLMLGGNGENISSNEMSEMDISAVQEAMNQMMGSAATSMSTIFDTSVNISPPSVGIFDVSQGKEDGNVPDDDTLIMVSFRLKIGSLIDSNILQLTTVDFARRLVAKLLGTTEDNSEESISEPIAKTIETPKAPTPSMGAAAQAAMGYQQPINNGSSSYNLQANVNVQQAQFGSFDPNTNARNQDPNLGLLMDIPLQITVELGRTKKLIKDILELSQGSILELDKLAGEPVDIFANNKLIAKGEVVVIDENFGVRVTDIISQHERVRKLQ